MEPILIWAFAGLIVAFVLLVAELFIPSGGILGICAALFAIGAVILLAVHDTTWGLVAALGLMVVAPVLVAFMLKVWPHTPIGRRIIGCRAMKRWRGTVSRPSRLRSSSPR
jgi:membrane protein implicated in regulation of membrane protease activity